MKSNKLLKHLKRAVSQFESRPILKCAHYDKDGSLAATDSHRVLYIKNFHEHNKTFNQDVKTMEIKEEPYPDLKRLLPDKKNKKTTVTVSLEVLLRVAKALNTQANEIIEMDISDNVIKFINYHDKMNYGEPVQIKVNARVEGSPFRIAFQAQYIIDACEFLLDAKDRYVADDVEMTLYSSVRPMTMEIKEGQYLYLVTPVRMNRAEENND
ncbi:DNA polymerase III subunit beta [Enterococcus sp. AZ126]|uniref:DNA polymerase III subunit beta n=1 Tax=Enterococcus sp. AZ126 TaxID=2774635 RepID=UPI003F2669B2